MSSRAFASLIERIGRLLTSKVELTPYAGISKRCMPKVPRQYWSDHRVTLTVNPNTEEQRRQDHVNQTGIDVRGLAHPCGIRKIDDIAI